MKLRRKPIADKFAERIVALYDEEPSAIVVDLR